MNESVQRRKTVGIITMHKVQNYGSALQAYATQHIIEKLGYDAQLIDYHFPNDAHCDIRSSLFQRIKTKVGCLFGLTSGCRVINLFNKFYKRYFQQTKSYPSPQSLYAKPPVFDIYLTGSDQVWNPAFIKEDKTFFLDFVKTGKKCSYASSFAIKELPETKKNAYAELLRQYDNISVREQSGAELVKELVSKKTPVVLDPTLLLTGKEWDEVSNTVKNIYCSQRYVFLYLQKYSFNPDDILERILKRIKSQLGIQVFITCQLPQSCSQLAQYVEAGPLEFLQLMQNAEFVLTASFHGTAFAVNFDKPFYSIIYSKNANDNRAFEFLRLLDLEEYALCMDCNIEELVFDKKKPNVQERLKKMRASSVLYLGNALKS